MCCICGGCECVGVNKGDLGVVGADLDFDSFTSVSIGTAGTAAIGFGFAEEDKADL